MQLDVVNSDLKLHHLRDIYIDMKRNQDLDYENFLRPDVIQQCIEDKYGVSTYVQFKCKKKLWRAQPSKSINSRFEKLQLGRKAEGPSTSEACTQWRQRLHATKKREKGKSEEAGRGEEKERKIREKYEPIYHRLLVKSI